MIHAVLVASLGLKHRQLNHDLLETGHFLGELVFLCLDAVNLVVHALDRGVELVDLVESDLQ